MVMWPRVFRRSNVGLVYLFNCIIESNIVPTILWYCYLVNIHYTALSMTQSFHSVEFEELIGYNMRAIRYRVFIYLMTISEVSRAFLCTTGDQWLDNFGNVWGRGPKTWLIDPCNLLSQPHNNRKGSPLITHMNISLCAMGCHDIQKVMGYFYESKTWTLYHLCNYCAVGNTVL